MNEIRDGQGENIFEIASRLGWKWERILDFSTSINPLGLSKKAEKRLREKWRILYHYPDAQASGLKDALAKFHGMENTCLLAGSGSTEFIYSIPRILPIRRALIVTPALSEYEKALEINGKEGGVAIHYFETREEEGFELNVEGLLFALTAQYDALFLANPGNPTGIPIDRESLLRILALTEGSKTWLILDETFIDFLEEGSLKKEVTVSSRLIILRSLTSFFAMPGLRVGYLIANPGIIQTFARQQPPWNINSLAQMVAVESLKDQAYVSRTRMVIEKERGFLTEGLRAIPGLIPYPSRANYLLVQIHPSLHLTAAQLRALLIPEGILIRDCNSFQPMGPYFFRIAVRSRKENHSLLKALRKLIAG